MSQNPATNPNTIPQFNYGTLSSLPVAEQNQTYMAYFDGIGGTGPEVIDQTAYFIKYLIDTQGNVVNPEPSSNKDEETALLNLTDNYEPGKRANIKLIGNNPLALTTPNSNCLTGVHPITYVGRIVPILVTETGSGIMDYITTMSFGPLSSQTIAAVGNVTARSHYTDTFFWANETDWTDIPFDGVTNAGAGAWSGDGSPFTALSSSISARTRIKFRIRIYVQGPNGMDGANTLAIRLLQNGSVIYAPSNVATINPGSDYYAGGAGSWDSPYFDFNASDVFKVQYRVGTGGTGFQFKILGAASDVSDTSFTIDQETPTSPVGSTSAELIDGINAVYAWNGSSISYFDYVYNKFDYENGGYSILQFIDSASALFNSGLIQNLDSASALMNFSPITIPFGDIQPGDWIRFEYNKNQVYNIYQVSQGNNYVELRITPSLSNITDYDSQTINVNHFVIYRVINDGTYVVLDVKKDALNSEGESYTGIIQPEFVSTELKGNYDKIVTDLTQKNIIS